MVCFGAQAVARKDRVYLTTDADAAMTIALFAPRKGAVAVYEVEPIGAVEADPDCRTAGFSFQCASAKVLRVVATKSQSARRRAPRGL